MFGMQILAQGNKPPTPYYQRYVHKLVDTVRCVNATYHSLVPGSR